MGVGSEWVCGWNGGWSVEQPFFYCENKALG